MAQPFFSSGESFRMQHGILSCAQRIDSSIPRLLLSDVFFSVRQVISTISDYNLGLASMHTYPFTIEKSPNLTDGTTDPPKIFLNELLSSYIDRKLLKT